MTKRILILLVLFFVPVVVLGQFYESGRPSGLRSWRVIKDDTTKVIFSKGAEAVGIRTMQYVSELRQLVSYGYNFPVQKMPLVIWSGTALSNGLAMQAPRRVEFVAMPDVGSYSEPWLWQLTAHELRHTVQFSNVNHHIVKALSYVFGEQVELLASGLMPFWMLEGDAVWSETRLARGVGRGEQPSFSMAYRALGKDLLWGRNVDKWFSGSYRDFVPDHYQLGYQMVKYVFDTTGRVAGNDVADYTSRYPFLVFTAQLALKKHYGMYTPELFRRTFSNLIDEWAQLGIPEEDSARRITAEPKNYTTYSYPLFLNDTTIIALKKDFDDFSHFVAIDVATGNETFIRHTGYVSTRPELKEDRLMWTEYQRNAVWDGEVGSLVMTMWSDGYDIKSATKSGMALFPTFQSDTVAYLKYNMDGEYSLVCNSGEYVLSGVEKSYHGLAWDDTVKKFYMIALSDNGMSIESFDTQSLAITQITTPRHVTLSDLRASNGVLYYGSVESGQDEVYRLDLATGTTSQISLSRYGAFAPAVSPSGQIAMTTYSKKGYAVAVQDSENWFAVSNQQSENTVIGERAVQKTEYQVKKYGKFAHLFRIHSWKPLNVDYEGIMDGSVTMPTIGATLLSQNTLGTSFAQVNYGYDVANGIQSVSGSWRYEGFLPKIKIGATWSNVPQFVYTPEGAPSPNPPTPESYSLTLSALAYMPVVFNDSYHRVVLTPTVQYLFNNTKLYFPNDTYRYNSILAFGLQISDRVKMAVRDLYPRWGGALSIGYISSPTFPTPMRAVTAYGQLLTPGVAKHHSLSVEVAYQSAGGNYLMMAQRLVPRGIWGVYPVDFSALSANYAFPVVYPDWGVQGVFFMKRISARLGADYATWLNGQHNFNSAYSLGGTLSFDITPFRMPDQATSTLLFSLFFPSNATTPYWSIGFSAPI